MKRKIIVTLFAVCAVIACVFGLGACGGFGGGKDKTVTEGAIEYRVINWTENGRGEEYLGTYIAYADGSLDGADVAIPSEVNGIAVTAIGEGFSHSGIKSLVLPDSIKFIYTSGAFSGCEKLEKVTLSAGLEEIKDYAFSGCVSLKSVTIPEGINKIGYGAFKGCTSLESAVIPNSVTEISDEAFFECTSLETVVLTGKTEIASFAFPSCPVKNLTVALDNLSSFSSKELENVVLTEGDTLPSWAFNTHSDTSLDKNPLTVTMPSTIRKIEADAFYGRRNVTIDIPGYDTLYAIDFEKNWHSTLSHNESDGVFTDVFSYTLKINGEAVTELEIPDGVTFNGHIAEGFGKLESFSVSDGNRDYFSQDGVLYSKDKTCFAAVPLSLKGDVTIPYGISAIGEEFNQSGITGLHFPDSVTSFEKAALSNCTKLESLTIPFVGLTENDSSALLYLFSYSYSYNDFVILSSLKTLIINRGVIGEYAFSGCANVIENLITGDGVTQLNGVGLENLKTVTVGKNVTSISGFTAGKLLEIYNYSDLLIEKGSYDNGCIARNAAAVYTSADQKGSFTTTEDGFTFFEYGSDAYLIGYSGTETSLTLPEKINGKNYAIHNYAFYFDADFYIKDFNPDDYDSEEELMKAIEELKKQMESKALKSVLIPGGVTAIGDYAFCNQSFMTDFAGADGVTNIGEYAFSNCTGIALFNLPNAEIIGEYAFLNCTKLESVVLGSKPLEMSWSSFNNCENLFSVTAHIDVFQYLSKSNLTAVNLTGGTALPDGAFGGCNSLKSVHIADTFTEIGGYAFSGCSALETIEIPDTVTSIGDRAFYDCSSVTSLDIPESVTDIGSEVFTNCSGVNAVTVGGVKYINKFAVGYDSEAVQITIREGTTHILESAFAYAEFESIVLPESITFIGRSAFSGCANLVSINLPEKITLIRERTFYGCEKLVSVICTSSVGKSAEEGVILSDRITSIGDNAFDYCTGIKKIVIPDEAEIGTRAFQNCYGLESATGPASMIPHIYIYNLKTLEITSGDEIKEGALRGCGHLEKLTLPFVGGGKASNVTARLFGYIFGKEEYTNSVETDQYYIWGQGLLTVTFYIPETLTEVTITGGYLYQCCFSGCTTLKSINIADSCDATRIELLAFYGCTSLESFNVPDKIEEIEQEAFSGCTSLSEINLNNVCFIRTSVFENCSSLENLFIPRSVVAINENAFKGCTGLKSVEFAILDWGLAYNDVSMGVKSMLTSVSDTAQNAVRIRSTWLDYTIANVTRIKEYYKIQN